MSARAASTQRITDPLEILRKNWGYDRFRPMQREIIDSVLGGNDTLGLLPTGGGKSITFQVPALAFEGLTVVVTPLISLMKDQVDNLLQRGVQAVCLHSGLTRAEHKYGLDRCMLGRAKLLYVSPERLQSKQFIDQLSLMKVSLLVVDEAHCISQWGYDFRPSYLNIVRLREIFPSVPVLALTASATPEVRTDIMSRLAFRGENVFALSFARPNISYAVRYVDHKDTMLLRALRATSGTAIVYVRSRRRTYELAQMLQREGISALHYHAGLSPDDKSDRQERWKRGEVRVIVATNAFGMGIDKPDVRLVVHYDLPPSLEEYYQEAGRAGRDGRESYALVIASKPDKGLLTRRVGEAFPPRDYIRKVYELVCVFCGIAVGEGFEVVREFDLAIFCNRFHLQPAPTRSALMLLTRAGWLEYVEDAATRSRIMLTAGKTELYDLRLDGVTDSVLQLVLRTYTGLFADYVNISESLIARRLNLTEEQVYQSLLALCRAHVASYVPHSENPYIYFTTAREETRHVLIPRDIYEVQRERMAVRVRAIQDFVFGASSCRVARMLRYFGDTQVDTCGKCDVCREQNMHRPTKKETIRFEENVIRLASQPGGRTIGYIAEQLSAKPERVIEVVRELMDDGTVVMTGDKIQTVQCE